MPKIDPVTPAMIDALLKVVDSENGTVLIEGSSVDINIDASKVFYLKDERTFKVELTDHADNFIFFYFTIEDIVEATILDEDGAYALTIKLK